MTLAERRALSRAATLLVLSGLVRFAWEATRPAPDPSTIESDLPELLALAEEVRAEEEERRRPLEGGEKIDVNRADAIQLDRLPGVGAATAVAIVEERKENGLFLLPEDLARVRGIGSATVKKIRPHVEIRSTAPHPQGPRSPPSKGHNVAEPRASAQTTQPILDLNRADAEALESLPGIGPTLASRILVERDRRGRFGSVDELLNVSGIGPATVARLRDRISVR